jgi:hypothetical protein
LCWRAVDRGRYVFCIDVFFAFRNGEEGRKCHPDGGKAEVEGSSHFALSAPDASCEEIHPASIPGMRGFLRSADGKTVLLRSK